MGLYPDSTVLLKSWGEKLGETSLGLHTTAVLVIWMDESVDRQAYCS